MNKPHSYITQAWDALILLLAHVVIVEVPLRLTFHYSVTPGLLVLHIVITGLLISDILMTLFPRLPLKGASVLEKRLSRGAYLKTWFPVEVLACIPFDLFVEDPSGPAGKVLGFSRMLLVLKLLRWDKIRPLMNKLQIYFSVNPAYLRLGAFSILILLIGHWITCGFIHLWGFQPGVDLGSQYLRGYYWAVTTLTTVGYGDITPTENGQILFTMMVEVLGVGFYGFVIGNIANLLRELDVAKSEHQRKLGMVDAFLGHKKIPVEMRRRVHEYYGQLWRGRHGINENDILGELPHSLRTDIAMYINRGVLQRVPFFQRAGEPFLRELVLVMKPLFAMPGDYILRRGDVADRMFFINRGRVAVYRGSQMEKVAELGEGDFFGEMSLLEQSTRNADVLVIDTCELYSLDKESFDKVVNRYPSFKQYIRAEAEKRSMNPS